MTPSAAQLGRFTIRDVNLWDAPDVYALFSNPDTVRYMGVPQLRNLMEANVLISRYQAGPGRWLSVLDGTQFLGLVGLEVRGHQATLALASNGLHRGLGREISRPLVDWLFSHPQIWRVWSYVHVDNIQGRRATERFGAQCEGRLRRFEMFPNLSEEPQDCFIYSIVR